MLTVAPAVVPHPQSPPRSRPLRSRVALPLRSHTVWSDCAAFLMTFVNNRSASKQALAVAPSSVGASFCIALRSLVVCGRAASRALSANLSRNFAGRGSARSGSGTGIGVGIGGDDREDGRGERRAVCCWWLWARAKAGQLEDQCPIEQVIF